MSIALLILANFVFNYGLFHLTRPDNILSFLSFHQLGKWGNPLTECIECMSSFWGFVWFLSWVLEYVRIETLALAPAYIVCLYGVTIIIKKILDTLAELKKALSVYIEIAIKEAD